MKMYKKLAPFFCLGLNCLVSKRVSKVAFVGEGGKFAKILAYLGFWYTGN